MNTKIVRYFFTLLLASVLLLPGCSDLTAVRIENPECVWVDSFRQLPDVNGIDIIWVIDTSGSMSNDQDNLLAGIEAMMMALPPSGWRLNMISTEPSDAGIQLFPLVPGDSIDDAKDMLEQVQIQSNGSAVEKGFSSIMEYVDGNPYSSTWMRMDALLLTVFVSDEEEQSLITTSSFVDWYSYTSAWSSISSIVNIDPDLSSCEYAPPVSQVGNRYMDAANFFNGVIVDICAEDWAPGVRDASNVLDPIEMIDLTQLPREDSIVVLVDRAIYIDWVYIESENRVRFTVPPPPGTLVEVAYNQDIQGTDDCVQ